MTCRRTQHQEVDVTRLNQVLLLSTYAPDKTDPALDDMVSAVGKSKFD